MGEVLTPESVVGDRLSVRAANVLYNILGDLSTVTLAQVAAVTHDQLRRAKNTGPKTIAEIRGVLREAGLDVAGLIVAHDGRRAHDAWTVRSMSAYGADVLVTLDAAGSVLRVPYSAEAARALHVGSVVMLRLVEVPRG